MTLPVTDSSTYADFAGLDALKGQAAQNDPAALRAVAKQFESLFARLMIKSMRDASGSDPIFGSDQQKMYQGMFDDQLSLEITKGKGLGLADMLVQQLQRMGVSAAGTTASSPAASKATGASPSATGASPTPPAASDTDRMSFIQGVWNDAQHAAQQLGVDPRNLVAQAALETNWGRNMPKDADGRSSNNLFGVKATQDWPGPSATAATHEVQDGAPESTTDSFRAYESRAQSFGDYVALLRGNPRYTAALNTGGDTQAFATALQRGGYATDPDYARKVSAVAGAVSATLARVASAEPAALKSGDGLPLNVTARTL
jgi:flagellar protein FlgJ